MKKLIFASLCLIAFSVSLTVQPVLAKQIMLGGKPLTLLGYLTQSAQFGLKGNHFDTEQDLQQALMNVFVEMDYRPREDLTFYLSGLYTIDWVYDIKHDDHSWEQKRFNESRGALYKDDEYWQVLKEAHVTWAPGSFLFRIGKQIVSWGEMDFFRVMDQINPVDDRRGFSDVEFETTIIPIWLLRAEYWLPNIADHIGWMQDLGFQFVFNPNADFIADQSFTVGNEAGGIWAAEVRIPFLPFWIRTLRLGPLDETVHEPDDWDDDGFEYGFRMTAMFADTIFTLNGFYGRENSPSLLNTGVSGMSLDPDGRGNLRLVYEGKHFLQRFVGATLSTELKFIQFTKLGGNRPVLRIEAQYEFDTTYLDELEVLYYESDTLHVGVGLDWSVKINSLNPRAYILVMPQFFWDRIIDYPSQFHLLNLPHEDILSTTLLLETRYFNAKLVPMFAWSFDITNKAHLMISGVTWNPNANWSYSVEAAFMQGEKRNQSLQVFRNKDYITFKVQYNWF